MRSPVVKTTSLTLFFAFLLTASAYGHADVSCSHAYQWSANGRFLSGDFVRNKGLLYKAKRNATTEKPDPANTSGPWEYRGVCAAYGSTSAQCDFNGDGNMDLAKGLPLSRLVGAIISSPNQPNLREYADFYGTGEVSINYGNTSPDTPPNQIWNQNGLGMSPYARRAASFGHALSTGDFNKDNFCDLAISAPGFSLNTAEYAKGMVNVLYGSPNGLTITVLGENGRPINPYDAQRFDQDTPGIPEKAEAFDSFGHSMARGDFNGDGYDDLAVGVPQLGEVTSAGYFHIIYGSKVGLQTSAPTAVGYFQHLSGVPLFEVETSDFYGLALAAADFDNDGYTDIVVSASGEDQGQYEDSGKLTLLRGSATGIDIHSRIDISLTNLRPDLVSSYTQFGRGLKAGDFNSDGFPDLEIDFYNQHATGNDFYGKIYVEGSASSAHTNAIQPVNA